MQTTLHDPTTGVYAAGADYAHAIELAAPSRLVFVAGTMGLDADSVAGRTLDEQLDLVWANVRTILASAGMTLDHVVRVTSYLRDARDAEANTAARVAALRGRRVPTTAVVVETLDPSWRVEIEVVAAA
ncbi:MAG TPA: RidA family protein [Solirubrobacteraceae bacterium]|jgi:enamine deaminase RidA (YjgF/YER057c/UK114 family)|nr:RidA family protein [Solirubrobacteraceae bacterium]